MVRRKCHHCKQWVEDCPEWVELTVPGTREAAERIQSVMTHLDADLAPDVRETIAYAFRELLLNAVECWRPFRSDTAGPDRLPSYSALRPGGFGLVTVRASVDELLYNEKRNEATAAPSQCSHRCLAE